MQRQEPRHGLSRRPSASAAAARAHGFAAVAATPAFATAFRLLPSAAHFAALRVQ